MKVGIYDTKKLIVTDFETYYDDVYTLRKLRNEEYIMDKRFQAHGVAVAYPNGKTEWIEAVDIKKWLKAHRKFGFVGHNYYFDGLIWKLRYGHSAPQMLDTKLLANAIFGPAEVSGGNDLESVAERMGLQPKGKVEMFQGLHFFTPDQAEKLAEYGCNDADLEYHILQRLLPQLSRPDFETWLINHTLDIYINKPLPVDAEKCRAGIKKIEANIRAKMKILPKVPFIFTYTTKKKRKAGDLIETHHDKKVVTEAVLASNPQFGQALTQTLKKHKVAVPMKYGKKGLIPALAKGDEAFMALASSPNPTVSAMVTARLAKRSGDTQVARLATLIRVASAGGFRPYLNYWGAGTGRWSGGGGLNAHNFPNPSRSRDEFEREVSSLIRECVGAGRGRVFAATDAANIEARVLAWWAGQKDLVEAFGKGQDVYSEFAAGTFKEEVRKPKPEDPPVKAGRLKRLRGVGKASILGLGYSMGAPKFELNLRTNPEVSAMFKTDELNTPLCEKIVKDYRAKYREIVALWGKVESAFFKAQGGAARAVNGVLFSKGENRGVDVTLPCGRVIHYPRVRVGEAKPGQRVQWVYGQGKGKKIYGGLLVENIVQAMSRDILAEGVWAMEEAGWPVCYHVHDSIVCNPPAAKAKTCLEYCIQVLSQTPVWGQGMMLGAEGSIEKGFA